MNRVETIAAEVEGDSKYHLIQREMDFLREKIKIRKERRDFAWKLVKLALVFGFIGGVIGALTTIFFK